MRDDLETGALVQVLPELAINGAPLNLVWLVGRQLEPKVDIVPELLAAELRIS